MGHSPKKIKDISDLDPLTKFFFVTMDVTFLESKSYFGNTHLQGENENEDSSNVFYLHQSGLVLPLITTIPRNQESLEPKSPRNPESPEPKPGPVVTSKNIENSVLT